MLLEVQYVFSFFLSFGKYSANGFILLKFFHTNWNTKYLAHEQYSSVSIENNNQEERIAKEQGRENT